MQTLIVILLFSLIAFLIFILFRRIYRRIDKTAKYAVLAPGNFNATNIILSVANFLAVAFYLPVGTGILDELAATVGGLAGFAIAIVIIFKVFRLIPKITQRIENTDRISLTAALSIYLFIWASTHHFFGLL